MYTYSGLSHQTIPQNMWTDIWTTQVICLLRCRFAQEQLYFLDKLLTGEWCTNAEQILSKNTSQVLNSLFFFLLDELPYEG